MNDGTSVIQTGIVAENQQLCREHYRLTFSVPDFPPARPGQFVHLCPEPSGDRSDESGDEVRNRAIETWAAALRAPMLRRAFSIAGLQESGAGSAIDVIYRVVGAATRWMASLAQGDSVSVLGPLGGAFPISSTKKNAWLVAGGVGLPPMLWLAQTLNAAKRNTIAFCGAQSVDLLALSLNRDWAPASDATTATRSANEFARWGVGVVVSTDDGSYGFHGHIGQAFEAYHQANPMDAQDVAVYTCGPERMMQFVAEYCLSQEIECFVCMERAMACGTGTCQSCVVPVRDNTDDEGWRYRLCCTEGPIFDARDILWEPVST